MVNIKQQNYTTTPERSLRSILRIHLEASTQCQFPLSETCYEQLNEVLRLAMRCYLGTMTFAWSGQTSSVVNEKVALDMVQRFIKHNEAAGVTNHLIDTARVYAAGKTEPMVGDVLGRLAPSSTERNIIVGTKANPAMEGGLSTDGIKSQIKDSLTAMNLYRLGEYYLHQPDTNNPLLESLMCTSSLVADGTISSVGMSNYHACEVERAFDLCKEHNLTPPTVYQGLYNPLNRLVEEELLSVLRKNGASFVAYNPLAAGLLTGKHKKGAEVAEGRFKNNNNYLPRFYTDENFLAIDLIREACENEGISMVEATFRWMLLHSALDPDKDGILLGASSVEQLEQNLDAWNAASEKGPLSSEVLAAFEEAWKLTKPGAFAYWRSYSSDHPGRESLDQGASYTVKK